MKLLVSVLSSSRSRFSTNSILLHFDSFAYLQHRYIKPLFLVVSTIPKIVCETLAALGLQEEIPSWKIMDNKGKITVVLHWEKDHPPGQPPSLQVVALLTKLIKS